MALFAKKDKNGGSPVASPSSSSDNKKSKGGLKFGRSKNPAPAAATPAADDAAFEDFADFAADPNTANGATANGTVANGAAHSVAPPVSRPKPPGLKGGAVVGLNIGNDSIKAVEVKGKGGQFAVTAMGIAPTPPESLSNGVVMSTSALSSAIRDLLQRSGIKTKRVITSVAGSSALVVRVIEVPQMSDNELKGNMTSDADRYIPFPPSEVIMDFKALRELPAPPDASNMEVLLAAAQREIVDSHINVLGGAKLDPQAIDVEPLAAARSLSYDGLNGGAPYDPSDVWALINIGATSSEISVLRGDILVFTRSIPRGGNALTQAIVDTLGVSWSEAEKLKRELGDALPPHTPTANAQTAVDDFSDFGDDFSSGDLGTPTTWDAGASGGAASGSAVSGGAPGTAILGNEGTDDQDWSAFAAADDDASQAATPPAVTPPAAQSGQPAVHDPFDPKYFDQGPQGQEPQERHQQKQGGNGNEGEELNFSSFSFGEPAQEDIENLPGSDAPAPAVDDEFGDVPSIGEAPVTSTTGSELDIHSALHPEETTPRGQLFSFDAVDDPSLPSFPTLPSHLAAPVDEDDLGMLPTETEPVADVVPFGAALGMGDSEDIADIPTLAADAPPVETGPAQTAEAATSPATGAPAPSVFDFSFESLTPDPEPAPVETTAVSGLNFADAAPEPAIESASSDNLLDLDALIFPETTAETQPITGTDYGIGDLAAGLGTAGAVAGGAALAGGAAASAAAAGQTPEYGAPAYSDDEFTSFDADPFGADPFNMDAFGAGLVGGDVSGSVTAETIYGILHPILEEMVGEIRRSLEYFGSRYPDAGVHRLTLIGGGAQLTNFDAYLTQSLGIPATIGNPFTNVVVRAPQAPPGFVDENGPLFGVALGLALRDLV